MPTKDTRARMTHEQKRAMREHHIVHPALTQEQLAEWAESAFKFSRRPSRMTLFRVLREPVDVHEPTSSRKNQHVQSPDLDADMLVWIHLCEEYKLPVVTGASIQEKTAKTRDRLANIAAPPTADALRPMVFSHEWLYNFQLWHNLTSKKNRRILLLVDNVSLHRLDAVPSSIKPQIFSPNTISFLQPQNADIINAFKAKINRLKQRHVVDQFDDMLSHIAEVGKKSASRDIDALLKVNMLVAMKWAQEAWEEISRLIIENCWRHTKILDEDVFELVESIEKLRVGTPALGQLLNQL